MEDSKKRISSQKKFCKIIGLNSTTTSGNKSKRPKKSEINHRRSTKKTILKSQCPQCPKQLSSESNLKIHLLQIHKMHSSIESLTCNVCNMILNSKAQLEAHIDAHYEIYESNSPSYYFCTTCKLSFSKKSDLSYHNEHVCKHVLEVKPSLSCPEVYAVSLKRKIKIVDGRLIDKPQSVTLNADTDLEDDIEIIEEGSVDEENPGPSKQGGVSAIQKNFQQNVTNRRKRRYKPSYQEMVKMKNSNPVLLKNPKSTLVKFKHSYLEDDIVNLQINKNTPKEIRVLSIATEQVVDRSIKCFRCNLYFKTHKDLKTHLDEWHIAELTELNHQFTKQEKMVVKHKCPGCTLSFPKVRQLTKHYYKDCKGNPKTIWLEAEESRPAEEEEPNNSHPKRLQDDTCNHDDANEVHTSDAELLTYLQQAVNNNEKPQVEMHIASIASIQVNDRSVKCIRCNFEYPGHKELKKHLDEVHQQELSALSSKFIKDDKIEVQHRCSRCSLSFTTVRLLTKHYTECTEPERYPTEIIFTPKRANINSKPPNVRTSPRKTKKTALK